MTSSLNYSAAVTVTFSFAANSSGQMFSERQLVDFGAAFVGAQLGVWNMRFGAADHRAVFLIVPRRFQHHAAEGDDGEILEPSRSCERSATPSSPT